MVASVAVLTPIPAPYQVEFFEAIVATGESNILAIYTSDQDPTRFWKMPALNHEHIICSQGAQSCQTASKWVADADVVVFGWYSDRFARQLLRRRAKSNRAWCLWGERPGFSKWRRFGRVSRWWRLSSVRHSKAPIWGMGSWAVDGWRKEFGNGREYHNVPYYSDLSRFHRPRKERPSKATRRFIYSGSLIERKGVDLLARAFAEVASTRPNLYLDLVGIGPLEAVLRKDLARVSERVRFLGFREWHELPAAYHEADVLVAPSRYDGWGLVVPEGLAAGLPVIATDRMGAAIDLVHPGQNGWRIRSGELGSLVRALAEAADAPENRLQDMSDAATASIANHTLGHGASKFVSGVRGALAESTRTN